MAIAKSALPLETASAICVGEPWCGLFRVQPRRRFIEHQNFRLGHHAAGNLQPTLVAVGQVAGLTVGMLQQADTLQPGGGPVQRFALRPTEGRRFQQAGEEPGFQLLMLRHQQVFNHRHFAEQAHVLEGPHHAHPRNLLTRQPFQVLVAQQNSEATDLQKAQIEQLRAQTDKLKADNENAPDDSTQCAMDAITGIVEQMQPLKDDDV